MSIQTTRLQPGDTDVRIHVLEQVDATTVRIKVVADRCWRLEVDLRAEEIDVLASYDAAGDLADVPLPDGMDDYHVVGRDENHFIGNGKSGSTTSARERLVMNVEPEAA